MLEEVREDYKEVDAANRRQCERDASYRTHQDSHYLQ